MTTSAPTVFDCVADCQVKFGKSTTIIAFEPVLGNVFSHLKAYPDCEFFVWVKDISQCFVKKDYTVTLSNPNHFTGEAYFFL